MPMQQIKERDPKPAQRANSKRVWPVSVLRPGQANSKAQTTKSSRWAHLMAVDPHKSVDCPCLRDMALLEHMRCGEASTWAGARAT